MAFCETEVGLPFAAFPKPMLMPKSGAGAACASATRAATPRKELRMRTMVVGRSERVSRGLKAGGWSWKSKRTE